MGSKEQPFERVPFFKGGLLLSEILEIYTCERDFVHVSSRLEISNYIYSDILQVETSLPSFVSNF